MTNEEILEDWVLERLEENPRITLEQLSYSSSHTSDEEWMEKVEKEIRVKDVEKIFTAKKEAVKPEDIKDFEEIQRETIP